METTTLIIILFVSLIVLGILIHIYNRYRNVIDHHDDVFAQERVKSDVHITETTTTTKSNNYVEGADSGKKSKKKKKSGSKSGSMSGPVTVKREVKIISTGVRNQPLQQQRPYPPQQMMRPPMMQPQMRPPVMMQPQMRPQMIMQPRPQMYAPQQMRPHIIQQRPAVVYVQRPQMVQYRR